MATQLRRMKIREISKVDYPASPGAEIILMKRGAERRAVDFFTKAGPADEPRDAQGRWTSAASAVQSGAQQIYSAARTRAIALLSQAGTAGKNAVNTRLEFVHPVQGGGLHFRFNTAAGGNRQLHTNVQVRPEHVKNSTFLTRSLNTSSDVLRAYGLPEEQSLAPRFFGGSLNTGAGTGSVNPFASSSAFDAARVQAARTQPMSQVATTVQSLRDKYPQGSTHPGNAMPVNWIAGRKNADGQLIPLNSPTVDYTNSNGHSYIDRDGDYVPNTSPDNQKYIAQTTYNTAAFNALPKSTAAQSEGKPYRMIGSLNVVPAGSQENQTALEHRYNAWESSGQYTFEKDVPKPGATAASQASITRIPEAPRDESSLRWSEARTNHIDKSRLFPRRALFDKRAAAEALFGEPRVLFDKNSAASEARDAIGRWTSGAGGAVTAAKAKQVVAAIKPMAKNLPHIISSGVAGSFGGVPDAEAMHLGTHVQAAAEYLAAKVAADPKYRQLAHKALTSARLLFRKAAVGALSSTEHDVLKDCLARALTGATVHPKVAASDAALAAAARMAHAKLCSDLSARKAA